MTSRQDIPYKLGVCSLGLFYVVIVMHLPVTFFPLAQHDDGWFIDKAQRIIHGDWFGSYNQNTLIKGGAYSLFLVINNWLGFPIGLTQALFFAGSVIFFASGLTRLGLPKILAFIFIFLILFQPALFPVRIIRENIYIPMMFLFLGLLLFQLAEPHTLRRFFYGVLSGSCLGLFLYTREEGIWIFPTLLIIWIGSFLTVLRDEKAASKTKFIFANAVGTVIVVGSISVLNLIHYQVFSLVDFKSSQFTQVLRILNSIVVDQEVQYVPVSSDKRHKAYSASPEFAKLRPFLEDQSNPWLSPSCAVYPEICGDFAGGWFMWAVRDATAMAGFFQTHQASEQYFAVINQELTQACQKQIIICDPSPVSFIPKITKEAWVDLPLKLWEALRLTMYRSDQSYSLASGYSQDLQSLRGNKAYSFLGRPYIVGEKPRDASELKVSGWYYSAEGRWIALRCGNEVFDLVRRASPDLVAVFGDDSAGRDRFQLTAAFSERCSFVDSESSAGPIIHQLTNDDNGKTFEVSGGRLHIDSIISDDGKEWKRVSWLTLKKTLGTLSSYIFPIVLLCGIISLVLAMILSVQKRRQFSIMLWLSISCWAAYGSRVFLLTMVDVTLFPALHPGYLGPAYAMMPTASLLSTYCFLGCLRRGE